MKNKQVVRVVLPDGIHELNDDIRVVLRFMDRAGAIVLQRDDESGMCFDLMPPAGVDARVWASHLIDGGSFNAVLAPECPREPASGAI